MAMKPAVQPSDNTGLSALSQYPPRINTSSPILASIIDLPPNPLISCSVFTATRAATPAEQLTAIESARRHIASDYISVSVSHALLPSVHVTKDRASLYLFALGSTTEASASQTTLAGLQLDSLEQYQTYSFTPEGIYPCSPYCAAQLAPCSACIHQGEAAATPSSIATSSSQASPACVLPRKPLRLPLSQFIQAVRNRLIDDIARSASEASDRWTGRLQSGFLLSPLPPADASEWGTGWEHYARSRPFVHCELQVNLSRTRLVIQPTLRSTQYFPPTTSLPLPAGTPIVLLPHGTPAFYLNTYSGAVGNLTRQFDDALIGLGAGNWKRVSVNESTNSPSYLIAWVSVQNKQGEEKGLPVIWPLALSAVPEGTSQARHKLAHLPDLPAQLLASPPAIPAQAPPINLPLSALNPPATSTPPTSDLSPSPRMTPREQLTATPRKSQRPLSNRSPVSDSLRAFHSLTIGRKNVHTVARDVSAYVDAVAKERERERERLKREREGSSSRIPSSPQKPESTQSTPAVAAKHERETTPAVVQQAVPSSSLDQVLPKSDEQSTAPPSWDSVRITDTGDMSESLPPVDVAPPAEVPTGMVSAGVADMLPETSGLPNGEVPMVVDDDASKDFDAFGFDTSWAQSSNHFMNTPLDDYGFAMGMSGANNNESTNINIDDGFEMFTEDDFDFFDRPQPTSAHPLKPGLMAATSAGAPLSGPLNGLQTSGPGPPASVGAEHVAPWTSHFGLEGLTPRSLPASTPGLLPAPELVPSTPLQTPPSQSGPVTPAVMLDHHIHIRRSSTSSQGSVNFDPIPFSTAHKATDGKYAVGKFALPTPPPDDVKRIWPTSKERAGSPMGWMFSYGSVTDPRIGVVRRLVGAKRKRLGEQQGGRDGRMSPAWIHEHEEWASSPLSPEEPDVDSKTDSDLDIDEETEDETRSALAPSRSFTPPLPYLPLGPSLVATAFHHSFLLPLSVALRPPGATAVHLEAALGPMSVPTPVSPAAAQGATSERIRTLEAVALFLVKEVVENPSWADAWRASLSIHSPSSLHSDIWQVDVRRATAMLSAIHDIRSPVELKDVLNPDIPEASSSFREVDPPMLAVGKSDALMQVLPAALRFWEKLGLRPRGGNKDVTAFVFFEGGSDTREAELSDWLELLGQTYAAKNLGSHTPGRAVGCTRDGLVPVQFDNTFRKTLVSFVQGYPDFASSVVIYIVVSAHMITPASLRQISAAIRRAKKVQPDASFLFHLVPEPLTDGSLNNPTMRHLGFEIVADAVYDRILILTHRMTSRALIADGARMQALFQEPAFALARPVPKKPTFRLEAHPSTLDVVDRFSILHVGYRVSPDGKWLSAACVDQWGEMHDLKAWVMRDDAGEEFIVKSVWALAFNIAARANVEWRIAIAKYGGMNELELDAWNVLLSSAGHQLSPSQVLVLVADDSCPQTFLVPELVETQKPPKSPYRVHRQSAGSVLHEASTATYLAQSDVPTPVLLHAPHPISSSYSFIPDDEEENASPFCIARPLASAALIRVPTGTDYTSVSTLHIYLLHSTRPPQLPSSLTERATLEDIAQNYHDLSLLARYRWKLKADPILPFHLAALDIMCAALACNESFMN